jgi:Helix-turn-helix
MPPEIRGDKRLLRELTGWSPTLSFDRTLADILAALRMLGYSASRRVVSAENATRLQQRGEAIASQPAEAIAPPAASVPRLRRTGRWSWTLTFSVGLPSASSRWSFDVLALLPLFVLGLVLRLVHLDGQSLWIDELSQARTARFPIPAIFDRISRDVAATPLDYLGEKLTTGVFGIGTFQVRLWAFGAGCLAVAAIYVVARQLSGSRLAAVIASGMLATSAFHVYYSQEAFADKVGLHRTYVGDLERGERNVGLANIGRIAEGLGCTVAALMAEAERRLPSSPR